MSAIRRANERNDQRVRIWLEKEYPAIAARARQEKAEIHWKDETGLRSDDAKGRSYVPKGKTPVQYVKAAPEKLNMISTVTNRGLMRFMFYLETMSAQLLIRFLKRLIRSSHKKIFLILDNLRVHHNKLLQEWLTENKAFIEIFYLPSYSPDLNPDELLNRDLNICEAFKNNRRRSKLFFTRSLSDTPDELQVLNCGSNIFPGTVNVTTSPGGLCRISFRPGVMCFGFSAEDGRRFPPINKLTVNMM